MSRRHFGSHGPELRAVGLGTWNLEQAERGEALAALRRGIDLGLSHIDTAEMYGAGKVEVLVGEAIAGRRDEVFLVSKVLPDRATRAGVVRACEESLARLGTDRLDCYLLHWPGSHPLAETIAGFEDLVAAGKIRSWGLSNFDAEDLAAAARLAGDGRIACNQVLYHLEERAIEHAVIPACEERGITVVAYSPFGSGRFPAATSRGGLVLAEIAAARGATPRRIALAFLLRRPSLLAIPKAAQLEHVADNAGALTFDLAADEVVALETAFPLGPPRALPVI